MPSASGTTLWLGHRTNRSIRAEQTYVNWIKRYIYFHNVRHPAEIGTPGVRAFLTHLAVEGRDFCDRLVANRLPFPGSIAVVIAGLDIICY
jgi:hypothetical protein